MTNLSVNLNKVALLRNQRDIGYPDLLEHAELILNAGAHGLTAHPRPDERHIRKSDVPLISKFIEDWNDKNGAEIEFNIEGYPTEDFVELVVSYPCHQVTLVPDAPDQRTSDHGWDLDKNHDFLTEVIIRLKAHKRRVSLFIDPDPALPEKAKSVGADRVELYTGPYAFAWEADDFGVILHDYVETAEECVKHGLDMNAGHDLNLPNLRTFLEHVPNCMEVSIGHAITDDALKMGWPEAVKKYLDIIEKTLPLKKAS